MNLCHITSRTSNFIPPDVRSIIREKSTTYFFFNRSELYGAIKSHPTESHYPCTYVVRAHSSYRGSPYIFKICILSRTGTEFASNEQLIARPSSSAYSSSSWRPRLVSRNWKQQWRTLTDAPEVRRFVRLFVNLRRFKYRLNESGRWSLKRSVLTCTTDWLDLLELGVWVFLVLALNYAGPSQCYRVILIAYDLPWFWIYN